MKKIAKITSYSIASALAGGVSNILISLSAFAFTGGVNGGIEQTRTADMPANIFGVNGIFTQVTSAMLFVVGVLSVIMLIFGGLRYIISNGDQKKVDAAKNTILYAIVGLIVAIMSYAIIRLVIGALTGNLTGGGSGTNGVGPTNV
jgi:hypothetical protein